MVVVVACVFASLLTLAIVCADAPLYASVFVHLHSESCKKFVMSYCKNWALIKELLWL